MDAIDPTLGWPYDSFMPRMRQKADLPTKDCAACGRPFAWRKKWARDWENVRFCSDACRSGAYSQARKKGAE